MMMDADDSCEPQAATKDVRGTSSDIKVNNDLYEKSDSSRLRAIRIERKCQDVLFLIVFCVFLLGMVIISCVGFANGDPIVLLYGPDYDGNICNRNEDGADLKGYKNRYWMNPNEVIAAENDQMSLKDAASICLKSCPDALPYGNLTWICKYPSDKKGINANITMDQWLAKGYDYFWDLDDEKKQASFLLEGPCYPSLTYSQAVFHVCQFRSVESTVSGNVVEEFKECIARFENITDPEEYVRRVNVDCQSDNVLEEETTSSIDPNAYYQYKTLAKALDMDYARIPGEDTEDNGAMEAALNDALSSAGAVMERYFGDFQEAWVVLVLCGALLPLVLSSVWMLVMRYFTWVLVWTTLITANILLFGLTIAAYVKSGVIGHDEINSIPGSDNFYSNPSPPPPVSNTTGDSSSNSNTTVVDDESTIDDAAKVAMLVCAVIGTVLTIILFLLTVLSIRRLNITIAILKVAAKAVSRAPFVVLYSVVPFLALMMFSAWWLASAIFVYSSGDIKERDCTPLHWGAIETSTGISADTIASYNTTGDCGYEVELNRTLQYSLLYMLFGFFWITQFIIAATLVTIAGVAYECYLCQGAEAKVPINVVWHSLVRTFRYHLGSIALGSLIMAIIKFIRAIVSYISYKLKDLVDKNPLLKFLVYCVNCCLWFVDRIISIINRNAYVMIAIDGENFCSSAARGTSLAIEFILQIAIINVVGDFMLLLGRVSITCACGIITFLALDSDVFDDVSSPLMPVIFVTVSAFVVSSIFMAVVEVVIDTMTLAYCDDVNDHNGKPEFAPPELMDALGLAWEDIKAEKAKKQPEGTKAVDDGHSTSVIES